MTRVSFYQVKGDTSAAVDLSCELVEKAWQTNNDVLIYTPDKHTLKVLDDRLWSYSDTSFLPHRVTEVGPETIRLCLSHDANVGANTVETAGDDPGEHHGLLINLAANTPDWFGRFEMLYELIYGDESHVATKRNRYKFYKDRGYPLSYHDMTERF